MKIVKFLMEFAVRIFFKVFFLFYGQPKHDSNLQKTIDFYKGEGFSELFAQIRAWDAPYEPIDKIISKNAKVTDLGSGDGLLVNYLAIASSKRKVFGIELNANRAKIAFKRIKNTSFKKGDILKADIPNRDTIILAHVLHHLPGRSDQEKLLSRISRKLKKNSSLIILEIDNKPMSKYIFSWLTDAVIVPTLFEGKIFTNKFFYRKSSEWKSLLRSLNFDVKVKSIHKGMPFSHVLIYAKKN